MKCSNCGADIEEGFLYCEQCGEDVHIVPDFEPELEFNMAQTLNGIREDVINGSKSENEDENRDENKKERKTISSGRKRFLLITGISCLVLLFLAGAVGGVLLYQDNSYEYQLEKAISCMSDNRYDKAIQYYSRAIELDSRDMEVSFLLAEAYLLKGDKVHFEYVLRRIIQDINASEEQLERAYGKLIALYKERGDYKTINEIVTLCDNEKIRETYQNFIARAPEFSHPEGAYAEILPLKLSTAAIGNIYYTLDGTEPGEDSELYTAPIFLDNGTHVVKAVFINEYGIASESVTKQYHIELIQIIAPEVNAISGEYYSPMVIEIVNSEEGEVYYTTDGSTPDQHSTLYTGAIHMPLGKSQYKFAFIMPDGSVGDVTQRRYHLRLNTEFTTQEAEDVIVNYMMSSGKILEEGGRYSWETTARYVYQYQFVANINHASDYYVFAEILVSEEGTPARTGSYYAVDAYDGSLFKLQVDERNNYTLVDMNTDTQ